MRKLGKKMTVKDIIVELITHIILIFVVLVVLTPILYIVSASFRVNQAVYGPLIDFNSWVDTYEPDNRINKISKNKMIKKTLNILNGSYYYSEKKITHDMFLEETDNPQRLLFDIGNYLSQEKKDLLKSLIGTKNSNISYSDNEELFESVYKEYLKGFYEKKKQFDSELKKSEKNNFKGFNIKKDIENETNPSLKEFKKTLLKWVSTNRGKDEDLIEKLTDIFFTWADSLSDKQFSQQVKGLLFSHKKIDGVDTNIFRYKYDVRTSLANYLAFVKGTIPNAEGATYPMLLWLFNTLIIASSVAIIQLIVVALAAYAFSRFRFKGKKAGLMFILTVQVFPGTMAMVALYLLLQYIGKIVPFMGIDTRIGLILVYLGGGIPMNVWLVKGYFDTIPKSLEESAMIDGATYWQAFIRIILPLVRPILAVITLLSFVGIYNEYILANIILIDQKKFTLPIGLMFFIQGQTDARFGVFSAICIIGSLPIVVLWLGLQNQIIAGLTQGSVKG